MLRQSRNPGSSGKNTFSLIIISLLFLAPYAFATDYLVEDGDEFYSIALRNYDTLLMTGGTGHDISLGGWSSGIIENTDPITAPGVGGVWRMSVSAYSELTINGGEFYEIVCDDESILNLHGGQILGSLTVAEDPTAWIHIYGYGFNNDPFGGSPLTGFWADGTPFSINLIDDTIPTYDQIVFHIIPEPGTMLLLGLGGLLLRKRKS